MNSLFPNLPKNQNLYFKQKLHMILISFEKHRQYCNPCAYEFNPFLILLTWPIMVFSMYMCKNLSIGLTQI